MGTVPFNFGQPTTVQPNPQPMNSGQLDFGNLPFNFAPFGGQNSSGFNGLPLSGTWASGGFNTVGQPSQSGFSPFFGTNTSPQNTTFGSFGVPQSSNFPAFSAPSIFGNSTIPFSNFVDNSGQNRSSGFNPQIGLSTIGNPGLGVTSQTQGPFPQIQTKELQKVYGSAIGGALSQFLNSGAGYNPQVVQALINQAMPLEARGDARLMQNFGNMGNAYSSTAAQGVADFESQFQSALSGQMAQLYEQSVQNYIQILEGTMGGGQQHQAQKSNWLSTAGEIAGIAAMFI